MLGHPFIKKKALVTLHNNVRCITLPQSLDFHQTVVKITRFYYRIFCQSLNFYQTAVKILYILRDYLR